MSTAIRVRPAAVAGRFYPADADTLAATVDDALARAAPWSGAPPKALVVPHAGFVYSGPVAATGYRALVALRDTVRRVVLLGPAHYVALHGLAVSSADAFVTPLGAVPVDHGARADALAVPGVVVDDRAHVSEHSLEVQLPFLQRTLGDFAILPLIVGAADARTVAAVLDAVWGGPETLIVVSSDLSHYLDHETATRHDRATAAAIVAGDTDALTGADACGAAPLRGLDLAARAHGLVAELVDLCTSADTAGDPSRVVGYGAFVFVRSAGP
jgi:MEMO1 family protein